MPALEQQLPPELIAAMSAQGGPPPEGAPDLESPAAFDPEHLPDDPQTDPIFEIPEGLDLSGVKDGQETEVLCVIEKHGNVAVIKSVDGVPLDKTLSPEEEGGGAPPPEGELPAGPPQQGPPQGPGGPTGIEGDMMARAMAAGLPMQ